jgi:hypothetical protein
VSLKKYGSIFSERSKYSKMLSSKGLRANFEDGTLGATPPGKEPMPQPATTMSQGLDDLIALNPHLTLADILALWGWIGPSTRVH